MYKQDIYRIIENTALTKDVYKMILEGDTQYITAPGQFINLKLEENFFAARFLFAIIMIKQ